ncbi:MULTISPECIES: amidophosphoribosyltransferase [Acidiplasma]|uniref:Amidophosphoribosyltransferase n=2 Tax=Acidiplasma TaxID=507753 RepID=A0A0Q0RYV5_9ARCH|nr:MULTISPECIES: amidophosphoribosyltransferase [Acidiplasma]KJE49447.1 amidophosphoribosyltransferase [Acidiplasma sp. MBA-1]KPV46378.1 amidophosphoribosyltransferase [Acidiplasma aeolicum]KQB35509.1 amidophosphoribosyltransferase [Acidiplasma cupricumulans]KQB36740.1 amidophosphoribosyltransferase [Acidiplasma aeolicum]WMT54579.1 MAG: amidophosphoribosyltransferase [Acidiplasma sp.]
MDSHHPESDTTTGQKPSEECAVVGYYGNNAFINILFGLKALQHRGQESSGMATYDGSIHINKGMGLVSEVFKSSSLPGNIGIGHNRYSTSGSKGIENAGPFVISSSLGYIGISHNGEITNAHDLREELKKNGYIFTSSSDTEVMLILMASEINKYGIYDGIKKAMFKLKGSYAAAILINNTLYALRDPRGYRPLVIGKNSDGIMIASESAAIDTVSGELIRDVKPGELVEINNGVIKSIFTIEWQHSHCMFEYVYFARPDSIIDGREVFNVRYNLGKILAIEEPAVADVVIPVPDSGRSQALGYAVQLGIPYSEGLIKNRYSDRTFIMPDQQSRYNAIKLKLNPIKSEISGKDIVLIDDSIVRGNTMKFIISLLKKDGAGKIHVRIGSPPIIAPCYFGVDMKTKDEFIANEKTVENIKNEIGADSLGYLSINGLKKAIGISNLCTGCLTGRYPEEIPPFAKPNYT